jgi:hypothetical protein
MLGLLIPLSLSVLSVPFVQLVCFLIYPRVVFDGVVDGGGGKQGVEAAAARGGVVRGTDGLDNGAFGNAWERDRLRRMKPKKKIVREWRQLK